MNVVELLTEDHRKVEALFDRYASGNDPRVLDQIVTELEVHTAVEEEIVYPRLAMIDRPLEEHAEDEHAEARDLIAQIRAGDRDAPTLVDQLRRAVQEHVAEEEQQAFPQLQAKLDAELETLGRAVASRKREMSADRDR